MLETLALMGQGFIKALTLINLLAMVGGVTLGIIIGCLPGLSAAMGVALMLPLTFTMPADTGLIVLGAIYCGAIFGGSISARNRDEGGALFEIRLPITRRGDLAPNAPADGNRAGGVSGPQPEQIS